MRIKPILGAVLTSTVNKTAHYFQHHSHQHTTSLHSSRHGSDSRDDKENDPVIQSQPLPLSSVSDASDRRPKPKIDASSDCKDFSDKNLSLQDMQQLSEEVQRKPFIGHIIWGTLPAGEEAHKLRTKIEQKIIQNNQEYKHYPSDFVHGLLSLHVYENAHVNEKVTFQKPEYQHYDQYLTQWTVHSVHDLPKLGKYYAVSYTNDQARQLVLAHRGTTATWSDLFKKDSPIKIDIIGVLGRQIVKQQKAVYKVTKEVATYAKENNYHFSTTGHSLGAWLAEFSVYYSVFEFGKSTKAVTFDSPGSIAMKSFDPNIVAHENVRDVRDLEIVTYLSDPNFVNTCNRHIGQVYRLYPDYQKPFIRHFTGSGREGFWSLWGHSLAPLLATFDPTTGKPVKSERMARWPVITYTSPDGVGKNMLTDMLGKAKRDASQERTITSLINLIADVWTGRIDQTQYLACWKHLKNASLGEKVLGDQFSLMYKGSYEPQVKDPFTGQLVSSYKGGADWYLKKLHDCPTEKIAQYFGEESLLTTQLVGLKAQYHLDTAQGHYQIVATRHTIEEMREYMLRLLDVYVTGGRVKAFLETHEQYPLIVPPTFTLTSYLPPPLGNHYILRIDELDQIDNLLADHAYVIISGEPGFGKTSLAIEYGHRQKNRPSHAKIVIKIDANSREKIEGAYRNIATELGIHTEQQDAEMIMRLVHNQISHSQKQVLLIFDHVEHHQDIAPFVDYLPENTKAIITTRHSRLLEGEPAIKVKPFTYSEAAQYIFSSAIKERIRTPQEVKTLIEYYAKGSGYVVPYHLNRALSIIKQQPIGGIKNYLAFVKAHPDEEGELILQQKLMAKAKLAWPLLQYAAYLDPDFIDLSIFKKLLHANQGELNEAICILESLSAMQVVRTGKQEGLSLHRLTQGIVRAFISEPRHQQSCLAKADLMWRLIQTLNILCPSVSNNPGQEWQQAIKLMPHVETVLRQMQDTVEDSSLIADLWDKSGKYATEILGLYHKAHHDFQKALAMRHKLYPDQPHPDLATSLNNVGVAYERLGGIDNRQRGLELQEQALAMRQALYPAQPHPDLANSLNSVGVSYENLGGIDNKRKGLALQKQALMMRQTLYPDQPHPDLAVSLNNVGIAYERLGGVANRQKGLALQEKALMMRQALYPDQPHPDLAASLNNVGIAYERLGGAINRQKGLALQKQALTMRQALYPDQPHPDLAASLNNVGIAYERLGGAANGQRGLALQEQALMMRQTLYPEQPHPDLAASLNNVGIAYERLGGVANHLKGLALQEQALAMRQALYPDQPHPDVAASLNNVGISYERLGGVENHLKGLALQEQALAMRQMLYPYQPHPDVATSLDSVGISYERLGGIANHLKGLALQEQALAIRQMLYSDPHPEMAESLHHVSISYANLDGVDNKLKGLKLQEQALAMRQALYADQPHPEVADSLHSIGLSLIALGQTEKGQDYLRQAKEMQQALERVT